MVPLHLLDRISTTALKVFTLLAGKWADRETGEAFPSVELIAETSGFAVKTVRRALIELEQAGALERQHHVHSNGSRARDSYHLIFKEPEDKSDQAKGDANVQAKGDANGHNLGDANVQAIRNQNQREPEKETSKETSPSKTVSPNGRSSDPKATIARAVFDHWIEAMQPQRRPKFTDDRKRKILARLNDGYPPDTLIAAIDGCASSDWHMGRDHANDVAHGGKKYNSIGLIFRNGDNVERFAEMRPQVERPTAKKIRETRSVMTDDEIAEARRAGEFPFDRASEVVLAGAAR